MDKIVNKSLLSLFIATLMLLSYIMGTYVPSVVDSRLEGLHEVKCDDIVSANNYYNGNTNLVCEIDMKAEDDNIHIYKGSGAIDE